MARCVVQVVQGMHPTQTAQYGKTACLSKVIDSSLEGCQASKILSHQGYLARALHTSITVLL